MKFNICVVLLYLLVKQVSSDCPEKCFCQSYYVKCMSANLQTLPSSLSSNVTVLDLRSNAIKDLKPNSFSTTPNLETLLLNKNQISVLSNGVFENLSKLRYLHLHRNKIETIEPEAFKGLQNLEQLYLQYNNIGQLGDGVFKNLIHLERLFLYNNNLVNLKKDVFATLPNIRNLRLDSNPLNCDCEIFWMVDYFLGGQKVDVQLSGICQTPASLNGKSLPDLKSNSNNEFQQCELKVKNQSSSRVPQIIIKPFDIDVPQFSSVELPCKVDGEPKPQIQWKKNNELVIEDGVKFRLNSVGSLRIYNVTVIDSGVYECVAKNTLGNDTARATLTVIGDFHSENDDIILQSYNEAKSEIDRAINATIKQLFSQKKNDTSPGFLMKLFRYPDEVSRNIIKPAEIYTRTLENVRRHIASGLKLNLTNDLSFEEFLTPAQIESIAILSGCVSQKPIGNCSNLEYSTFDGTCNNLEHPTWGSSYSAFRRILKPIYEDGISAPIGWHKGKKYYGYPKPLARAVTTSVIRTYNITPDEEITHIVMQWGQFQDHDLDHALPSTTSESWDGTDCKKTCAFVEPCFPMEVPPGDTRIKNRKCMDFFRTSAVCGSGTTSVLFRNLQPRQQLNQLSSYIDGTMVYGFTKERANLLRDFSSGLGLLRVGNVTKEGQKTYLPTAGANEEVDCQRDFNESDVGCFLAGDIRVNEQLGLLAMQTIWFREHNRLATQLKELNPHWDGDKLFFEARKILIAEIQHITYHHWLKYIIGTEGIELMGNYTGYKPDVEATIANVFATGVLRMGHTLINPQLSRLDENFKVIPQGNLALGKTFFAPWRLVEEGGVDPLMRGFFTDPAKRKRPTENLNDQLIDELFTAAHAVSLDLAALNIQRARDHGVPGYTEYRKFCGLSVPENFDQLKQDISNDEIRGKLKELYGHPGNVDIWVGGVLEDQIKDARIGPLLRCLLIEQFRRLRDGDRFWHENPTTFTPSQLSSIKKVTLARILCDNGDNITRITENVFVLPKLQNGYVSCDNIPKLDLKPWRDSRN